MIQRLFIRNYAIIDEVVIDFSNHLTIITGETGAGKSILLGALGLIMGKRADTKVLFQQDKKCIIEGHFNLSNYDLRPFFEAHELDYETETVIRREYTPSGKSRSFVNDTPVKLKVLQALSGSLIDLHQQFDTLDIHKVNYQLRMIDALAGNKALLATYQKQFAHFQKGQKQLRQLQADRQTGAQEFDFLSFQVNELQEAQLEEGEQEELEQSLNTLNNAEDIKRATTRAYRTLSEEETAISTQLQDLIASLGTVRNFDPRLNSLQDRLEALLVEVQDLSGEYESLSEDIEYDPQSIQQAQERLDLIYRLQKKHRVESTPELINLQDELQVRLSGIEDLDDQIESLQNELAQQRAQLMEVAQQLSKKRQSVTASFEEQVHQMLHQLSMPHARLKIQIQPLEALNQTGMDDIAFLFATNLGSDFLPVKDVASGGELSRLNLCTKSLVASAIPLPTLIFDEIDTGISGDVALQMGQILQHLAQHHQVVSITHTPQVAVRADKHYFVYKQTDGNRTYTQVKILSDTERIEAVATMLSGSPPSASAMQNARELLAL